MLLEEYRVERAPAAAYYIPEFISEEEEKHLIQCIYDAPKPKWKELAHRRLQNWGGLPHPRGMVAEPIPAWLQHHMDRIADLGAFGEKSPNHVLVNEYLSGQGIMPHEDGPMFYPTITTLSVSNHSVLDLYSPRPAEDRDGAGDGTQQQPSSFPDRLVGSLLLAPRSLLILQQDLYTSHLHGIKQVTEDEMTEGMLNLDRTPHAPGDILQRGTRISLTIRHVPRVLRAKVILGRGRRH